MQERAHAELLGESLGQRINIDVLNAQSQLLQTKRDLYGYRIMEQADH